MSLERSWKNTFTSPSKWISWYSPNLNKANRFTINIKLAILLTIHSRRPSKCAHLWQSFIRAVKISCDDVFNYDTWPVYSESYHKEKRSHSDLFTQTVVAGWKILYWKYRLPAGRSCYSRVFPSREWSMVSRDWNIFGREICYLQSRSLDRKVPQDLFWSRAIKQV